MSLFSDRIKQLKLSNNKMQKDIARDIGVSLRAYQYYETDQREPTLNVLISLADYFDVSLDYLVGRSDCPDIVTKDKDGNFIVVEAMQPHKD